jgi:hypothetical protein
MDVQFFHGDQSIADISHTITSSQAGQDWDNIDWQFSEHSA